MTKEFRKDAGFSGFGGSFVAIINVIAFSMLSWFLLVARCAALGV